MQGFSHTPKLLFAAFAISLCLSSAANAAFSEADELVKQMFRTDWAGECESANNEDSPLPIESWDLTFHYDQDADQPQPFRLYRIHCFNGAYNEIHVFYGADRYQDVRQIHFAEPKMDITYANDDYESSDYKIRVTGYLARPTLVNSSVEPETGTIFEFAKWRGLGDASNIGEWVLVDGDFVLKTYDVDAAFDGQFVHKRIVGDGEPEPFQ